MAVKFSNYFSTTLAAQITASQTSIAVVSSTGAPAIGGSDWFYATLIDQPSYASQTIPPAQREIVKVTAMVGNAFTVVRGADGTAGQSWAAGSIVEGRVNAQALMDIGLP
jgi:hypothetical protein